jgi:hypothetical protein
MTPVYELPFQGEHHFVEICFCGKLEAYLDAQVPDAFSFRDPLETYIPPPLLSSLSFASLDSCQFAPIYFGSWGSTEKV